MQQSKEAWRSALRAGSGSLRKSTVSAAKRWPNPRRSALRSAAWINSGWRSRPTPRSPGLRRSAPKAAAPHPVPQSSNAAWRPGGTAAASNRASSENLNEPGGCRRPRGKMAAGIGCPLPSKQDVLGNAFIAAMIAGFGNSQTFFPAGTGTNSPCPFLVFLRTFCRGPGRGIPRRGEQSPGLPGHSWEEGRTRP